jgi:hypothetical protein
MLMDQFIRWGVLFKARLQVFPCGIKCFPEQRDGIAASFKAVIEFTPVNAVGSIVMNCVG